MVPVLFMALRTVSRTALMVTGTVGTFGKSQRDALGGRKVGVAWCRGVPSAEEVADAAGQRDQYQPAAIERSLTPHSDAPEPLTRTPQRLCPFK